MSGSMAASLAALPLKKFASAGFRKAVSSGDAKTLQRCLIREFARPRDCLLRCPETSDSLFAQALSLKIAAPADSALQMLLIETSKGCRQRIASVCDHLTNRLADETRPLSPVAILVAADWLVRHTAEFSAEGLAVIYRRLALHNSDSEPEAVGDLPTRVARQILVEGELPFVLSLLLDPLRKSKTLRSHAAGRLAHCLEECTDTDGSVLSELLRNVNPWLSSLVRVAEWSDAFQEPWAGRTTVKRWRQAVECLASVAIPDGLMTSGADLPADLNLVSRAVSVAEWPSNADVPKLFKCLEKFNRRRPGSRSRNSKHAGPPACRQSDWATIAVMRNNHLPDADACSLDWDGSAHHLNLVVHGHRLLQGNWQVEVTVAGKRVTMPECFACTCWFQDNEVAFAELEGISNCGTRHIRHVMLVLTQHLAVITDTVTCSDIQSSIALESRLPLSADVTVSADTVTREMLLGISDQVVRAVPAWLEDDRVQHALGDFCVTERELVLTSRGQGGLTVPLVLDWHPDRHQHDADWNRLTVSEDRHVQSASHAAGFRIRMGPMQLLLYRSLRVGSTLRAVLGYHTSSETMYGRINNKGRIDPLVIVESDE
ncbi:MAG: hypothetical protein R3C59_10580 [Planctomycetaceae bacterium]